MHHSVRAASRLSLKLLRLKIVPCELNRANKHIPHMINSPSVEVFNAAIERNPAVKPNKMQRGINAPIATISARGNRSLINLINASFNGVNDIHKTRNNIALTD